MNNNPHLYANAVHNARDGDAKSVSFLRRRLASMSDGMPVELLLALSEIVLAHRRRELTDEVERN